LKYGRNRPYFNNQLDVKGKPLSFELVVARYKEDLAWLRNIPPQIRVTVYDKHPDEPHPGAKQLPNVGREAHTYLHHIVQRYNSLAPLTVFCQGKPFDHAFDFRKTLRELAQNSTQIKGFRWFGHIIDTDDSRGLRLFVPWSKNEDGHELDIAGFHRALFDADGPEEYVFQLGAQFAVTPQLIQSRPREFYEHALQVSIDFPDAAHCFERSWDKVFGVQGVDLEWLGERKTVYLKPIRRLEEQP
jgi:hypothetical protein